MTNEPIPPEPKPGEISTHELRDFLTEMAVRQREIGRIDRFGFLLSARDFLQILQARVAELEEEIAVKDEAMRWAALGRQELHARVAVLEDVVRKRDEAAPSWSRQVQVLEADNDRLQARVTELEDALQELYDWQNGPPLKTPKWLDGWGDAFAKAGAALNQKTEP